MTSEYRESLRVRSLGKNNAMYGKSHTCEAKLSIATKNSGPNMNKRGKERSADHRRQISENAKLRWSDSDFKQRNSKPLSTETKIKISTAMKGRVVDRTSVQKMIESRKQSFLSGLWVGGMTGKNHTPESIIKMIDSSKKYRDAKKKDTFDRRMEQISDLNFTLKSHIADHFLLLECNVCRNIVTRTHQVLLPSKIKYDVCPVCNPSVFGTSKAEQEIFSFLVDALPGKIVLNRDKETLNGIELDVVIPELKLAIEYCGLYWHGENMGKNQKTHETKMKLCADAGFKLVTIFEDEYVGNPDLVKSRLLAFCNLNLRVIYARKCSVTKLTSTVANQFLNEHHLQGSGRSNERYGLYSDDELVSVMTFSHENVSRNLVGWEINRFCTKQGLSVVGGASKLFKQFVLDVTPSEVISYADLRWGKGEVYGALGFVFENNTTPNYWYISGLKRIHRYSLRKNENDDPALTEWENRQAQGFDRIWDCGNAKWRWVNPSLLEK
jgi:hypothetical protein